MIVLFIALNEHTWKKKEWNRVASLWVLFPDVWIIPTDWTTDNCHSCHFKMFKTHCNVIFIFRTPNGKIVLFMMHFLGHFIHFARNSFHFLFRLRTLIKLTSNSVERSSIWFKHNKKIVQYFSLHRHNEIIRITICAVCMSNFCYDSLLCQKSHIGQIFHVRKESKQFIDLIFI